MEESIPSENCLSSAIFHKEAYTVLRMARSVQRLDIYITNLESFPILWCFRDALAVFASNNGFALEFGVG
jgi:hypothetical protein